MPGKKIFSREHLMIRPRTRDHSLNETQMERNLAIGRVIFNSIVFAIALCGIVGMVIFSCAHRSGLQ
jgi:hypothetical protein